MTQPINQSLRQKSDWLTLKILGWGAATAGTFALREVVPLSKGGIVAVAALGMLDVIREVRSLPQQLETQERPARSFRRKHIPDFRFPAHVMGISEAGLESFNRDEPIEFFVEGGGRVGIRVKADVLSSEELVKRLRHIQESGYPHLSRIKIDRYSEDGKKIAAEITNFKYLSYLSFSNSPNLEESAVRQILEGCPSLVRIDLEGCNLLQPPFCNDISQEYAITFPDGSSNIKEHFDSFYNDVRGVALELLLRTIEAKKKEIQAELKNGNNEKLQNDLGAIDLLDQLVRSPKPQSPEEIKERKERIKNLMDRLSDLLDPSCLSDESKKWALQPLLKSATDIVQAPYFPVLDTPFSLYLRRLLMCDDFFGPFLEVFQKLNLYLTSLDVSDSYLKGRSLQKGIGLPIRTLTARGLRKLDNQALECLKNYVDLVELDLSESPVSDEGLIRGVFPLPKIKVLSLMSCKEISDAALRKTALQLVRTLELLCVEYIPELSVDTIETLIGRAGEDLTKPVPLVISWTDSLGKKRVDISRIKKLDRRTVSHIRDVSETQPVHSLGFGIGSRLQREDFFGVGERAGLFNLLHLQIEHFNFRGGEIDVDSLQALCKKWPLKMVRVGSVVFEIDGLENGEKSKAAKIRVFPIDRQDLAQRDFRNVIFPFLMGFSQIDDLDLSRSVGFGKEQIDMLGDLCESRAVRRLNLSGIKITDKNLESLESSPTASVRKILEACDFIDLSDSSVSEDVFPGWAVDLRRASPCVVRVRNGKDRIFSRRS